MEGVSAVRENGGEGFPFHGKGVSIEPEDMVGVDLADNSFEAGIEFGEAVV